MYLAAFYFILGTHQSLNFETIYMKYCRLQSFYFH